MSQSTKTWSERLQNLAEKTWGLRLLNDAATVRHLDAAHRMTEKLAETSRELLLGGGPSAKTPKEDDVGLQVGDNTVTHNHYPAKSTSWLAKAALGAALLGGGAGVGVAVPWLLGAFDSVASPPPVEDRDTQFELRLVPP